MRRHCEHGKMLELGGVRIPAPQRARHQDSTGRRRSRPEYKEPADDSAAAARGMKYFANFNRLSRRQWRRRHGTSALQPRLYYGGKPEYVAASPRTFT